MKRRESLFGKAGNGTRSGVRKRYRIPRLEQLEGRSLLTTTLNAVATASIRDAGSDGTADALSLGSTLVRQIGMSPDVEDRAVVEFDLQALAESVDLAVLDFRLAGNIYSGGVYGAAYREFDVLAYSADGVASLSDFDQPGRLLHRVGYWAEQGGRDFRLDVTQELRDAVLAGATHWGLRFDAAVDLGPNSVYDLRLTVNDAPALNGQRSLETIPNAIRADGLESFRIEVDVRGEAREVLLEPWGNLFTTPGSGTLALRDDGLGGDLVAGDFVYSSGEFRFDTTKPFPSAFYQDNADSPPGVAITDVGIVTVIELDGDVSQFFSRAQVALLRADMPQVTVQTLASNVAVSDHFINVRTTGLNAQRTLRGPEIIPQRVTNVIYAHLPDQFDFFHFFSTQKVEQIPAGSGPNFYAGRHVPVKVDATGIGLPAMDNTGTFGSQGRLLGINLLDAFDRGIWGANVTHELVHQWSAHLNTSLGITEPGGHFKHNTSVGSLVGGQQWLPNADGTFTIDYDEGRSGATRASPLDRYLMGLVDSSEVPPIHVYDPAIQPPKSPGNPIVNPTEIIRTTTIDDIIAWHGPRTPGPASARRDFRIGFVAESHNRLLTPTEMTLYETLAAHYTKSLPEDEPDPYIGDGWAPITRFFGSDTTWTTLLPGRSEPVNHPPVAQGGTYAVPENAMSGTLVTIVPAADPDSGQQLVFAIKNNRDKVFLIDSATGRLTVNKTLDRETQAEHVLTIVVADTGLPSQADTVTVTIRVSDVNEFTPAVLPGQLFTVAEGAASGTTLGHVSARDGDAEAVLQNYAIVGGNADGAFAVDAATGALRVADGTRLDFETAPTRTLQVTVSDGVRTSDPQTVSIQITDSNDVPTIASETFAILENSANGTTVGTIAASDPDPGQTLTYAIISGNTSNAFALHPSTGRLTVNNVAALNYEANPTFSLSVRVADDGDPSRSALAIITVQLIDELEVSMDIDPGDSTNTINIRNENRIAVAILSAPNWSAVSQIDAGSLKFGRTGSENSLSRQKKTGNPITEIRDVNGDGLLDLVAYFETSKTGLTVEDTEAVLNGRLKSGGAFLLAGPVIIVNRRR